MILAAARVAADPPFVSVAVDAVIGGRMDVFSNE
jgi:hypothetical protein